MEGNRGAEQQAGDEETVEFHDFFKEVGPYPAKKSDFDPRLAGL
jgi:hypothetical protein